MGLSNKQDGYVSTQVKDGVAIIEFHHPKSNSLSKFLLEKLEQQITKAGNDIEVRVIVLQSAGDKVFCAGASFEELAAIKEISEGLEFFSGFAKVINAMRCCPKIIIGNVTGKSVGGGVGIIAACDYVFALDNASIRLSELNIGIGPFVVGPAIERKIGLAASSQLTLDAGSWYDSSWALQKGLYNQVFTNQTEIGHAVAALAQSLVKANPAALEALKKIWWQDASDWDALLMERATLSGTLVLSEQSQQAIAAFKASQK